MNNETIIFKPSRNILFHVTIEIENFKRHLLNFRSTYKIYFKTVRPYF